MPSSEWEDAASAGTVFPLPLVCRHGRPTALEHMSQRSLVTFVTCLLRHACPADERTAAAARQLAKMWPDVLRWVASNGAPGSAAANGDVISKCSPGRLRRLVHCWYRLLGCELLLPFSAALEREDHCGRLRLQRHGDGTSSLRERSSDRLVVTFRHDRMCDGRWPAPESSSAVAPKPASPAASTASAPVSSPAASVVKKPVDDCTRCGAKFVTLVAAMAHERLCDGVVSDCESVCSEPTTHTVSQAQFLGYLGVAPAASSGEQKPQTPPSERRRQRYLPIGELLLRLSRTDFSSPLGRRMLTMAAKQPTAGEKSDGASWSAARLDRYCCSRAVRAPSAEFPVTWTAPPPQPRVQPRVYCFTARQRAERAAAISTGLSPRTKALYRRLKPCSVVLTRLKSSRGGAVTDRHPPADARVLLVRLSEPEVASWLSGRGGSLPATPPGRTSDPAAVSRGGLPRGGHRTNDRQKLLRDECKTLRDESFFRLLDSEGRVTRGHGGRKRARSQSEGDRFDRPSVRRRMSLLESVQDRLHACCSRLRGVGTPVFTPSSGTPPAADGSGCSTPEPRSWAESPRPGDTGVVPTGPRRTRRLPLAVSNLISDECKTLRDGQFVRLLDSPLRTTRSAAAPAPSPRPPRRRCPVSVWLHWPGFAREPDHHTPVKHTRAAGEPRHIDRVPVVRLERLFRWLEHPAAGGGDGSHGAERPASCRRRLALDEADAELTARFVSRCRRQLLAEKAEDGKDAVLTEGKDDVRGGRTATEGKPDVPPPAPPKEPPPSPPKEPPPKERPPPTGTSPEPVCVKQAVVCIKRAADDTWYKSLLKRPRNQPTKALLRSADPANGPLNGDIPLDTVDNNNCIPASGAIAGAVGRRPRGRPKRYDTGVLVPLVRRPRGRPRRTVSVSVPRL